MSLLVKAEHGGWLAYLFTFLHVRKAEYIEYK